MKITVIAVGKIKEAYLRAGIAEYAKRLTPYADFEVIEVPDEPTPQQASAKEEAQIKEREGARILEKLPERSHVIALDLAGKNLTSPQLAQVIRDDRDFGSAHVTFIIGGSLGLSPDVLQAADRKLGVGRLTFPHQLMRLMLTEQIYRSFKIIRGEPYHK